MLFIHGFYLLYAGRFFVYMPEAFYTNRLSSQYNWCNMFAFDTRVGMWGLRRGRGGRPSRNLSRARAYRWLVRQKCPANSVNLSQKVWLLLLFREYRGCLVFLTDLVYCNVHMLVLHLFFISIVMLSKIPSNTQISTSIIYAGLFSWCLIHPNNFTYPIFEQTG